MISKFRKFIEKERLFTEDDKILLACSGGIDSMVLADLLIINENKFGIAHINHQTRGDDSDKDQSFVEDYCVSNGLGCHVISAPIKRMASEAKENFHAYARGYRYDYLHNIMEEHDYQFIATAHHSSDTLETFLINLTRGTGLDGLTGIPVKNNRIIRPLMFYNKEEIIKYADKFKVNYREDDSNKTKKYTRNYIRHEVIPEIGKLAPDSIRNAKSTIGRISKTKNLLDELILSKEFIKEENSKVQILKTELLLFNENQTLLFYLIKQFGFNFSQSDQIISGIKQVGSMYYSPTHQLLIDRDYILIEKTKEKIETKITLETTGNFKLTNGRDLVIEETDRFKINTDKNIEYFDADKLAFPMTIRKWKDGDRFRPIGMGGKQKKIKDLLINTKTNRLDKSEQLVLISNHQIAWVIGRRISESFKSDASSKRYYRMEINSL